MEGEVGRVRRGVAAQFEEAVMRSDHTHQMKVGGGQCFSGKLFRGQTNILRNRGVMSWS